MGRWHDRSWEPNYDAPYRRDQRAGRYRAYEPGPLCSWPLALRPEMSDQVADTERAVRALSIAPQSDGLEGLARFLLRSEAIASSRIEGLVVSAQQVAIAELAQAEEIGRHSFTDNARLVANNVTVLREAATALAAAPTVSVAGIDALHKALLQDPDLHDLRTEQNWLGGSDWHPLHTVLTRRGLTPAAILPISLVLLTLGDEYIEGLTAFRFDGDGAAAAGQSAVEGWLSVFTDAAKIAADQARQFSEDLVELHAQWNAQLSTWRSEQGLRELPRANSAVSRLIDLLPELPLFTVQTVLGVLGVSDVAARAAAEELASAGIVSRRRLGNTTGYFVGEVFELLNLTERRLASTKFDTRRSRPARPVPARPDTSPGRT